MSVNSTEVKPEMPNTQEKVETNLQQPKVEANDPGKQPESKETETQEDPNWRAFREARKKDRIEREQAEKRAQEKDAEVAALKAAMEAAFSRQAPSPQAYQQYYGMNQVQDNTEETEDQRIQRMVDAGISKREQENERKRMEKEQQEYPQRLMRELPDFNQVISQENRDYLDYHYPEVSRPLGRLNDGYDKWHDIYHAIKKLVPNNTNARRDSARADANMMKPKSISSTGMTQAQSVPGSHILSEERRAANWQRMQQTLKGVS